MTVADRDIETAVILLAFVAAIAGAYALGHHHGAEAGWWACMAEHGEVA